MPNAELSGMAGAEDREVWERRPFPLERLVRDARVSASQFRVVMRKTIDYTEKILYSTGYGRFLKNSLKTGLSRHLNHPRGSLH